MAYTDLQWFDVRGYYEAGLSLSEIQKKTGISRSTISKMAKKQQWKHASNADYIKAKELIAEKKATQNQHLLNYADEVAHDNIRRRGLVFGAAENLVKEIDNKIKKGKRLEKVGVGAGVQELVEVAHDAQDLKNFAEALDKAATTLEVAPRFANAAQLAIQNNFQNEKPPKVEIIRRAD